MGQRVGRRESIRFVAFHIMVVRAVVHCLFQGRSGEDMPCREREPTAPCHSIVVGEWFWLSVAVFAKPSILGYPSFCSHQGLGGCQHSVL